MSLRKQLSLMVSGLFLIMLLVILGASLSETRRYLEQQLASHAQDAASAMSLTLVQSLAKDDRVLAEAQVASMFDRGYFRRVDVLAMDRTTVVSKELPENIEGVPVWFSRMWPILTVQGEAHISSGWRQLGKVLVVSQPTLAYQYLWRTAVVMCFWMAAIYAISLLLTQLLLRVILQPLRLIEQSARAIQQKHFGQIDQVIKAPELARVVTAMNDMSRHLSKTLDDETVLAETLRHQAYGDETTGLANRRGFELRLRELLEGEYRFDLAAMIVVDLEDLGAFIRSHGFDEGLAVKKAVARSAEKVLIGKHVTLLARSNKYTFSFVVAGLTTDQIGGMAVALRKQLIGEIKQGPAAGCVSFSMGVAYFHQDDERSDIFARADLALESARRSAHDGLFILPEKPDESGVLGSFGWRTLIRDALKENRWLLVAQPVVTLKTRSQLLHAELMARLIDTDGHLVPASQFLPMAARHELLLDIDRSLVTLALNYQRTTGQAERIAINLSAQSVASEKFVTWLRDKLVSLDSDTVIPSFELSEFGCLLDVEAARRILAMLRQRGAAFGIDRFGLDPSALTLLRQMPPDYVKLNGGLVDAMTIDEEARAVINSITQLAHSLDIQVIAQNIETEEQLAMLLDMGVDGGQGYLFGPLD